MRKVVTAALLAAGLLISGGQSWGSAAGSLSNPVGLGAYKTLIGSAVNPVIEAADYNFGKGITAKVARINLQLSTLQLHPGSQVPGDLKLWGSNNYITSKARGGVVAAFNSGFKLKDSLGGFYANGYTAGKITAGLASLIIYKDGHVEIKVWPKDGVITPDIISIRQNIKPLMINGVFAKNINVNLYYDWGGTVSSVYTVWRSGVAVDGFGNLIYAVGNNLSPLNLVTALKAAGGVNAMELDINGGWVDFYYYTVSKVSGALVPHKLTNFWSPSNLYSKGWIRDFFTVSVRG